MPSISLVGTGSGGPPANLRPNELYIGGCGCCGGGLTECPDIDRPIFAVQILDEANNVLYTLTEGLNPTRVCGGPLPATWGFDNVAAGNGIRWWFWRDNLSGPVTYHYVYDILVGGVCSQSVSCTMVCPLDTQFIVSALRGTDICRNLPTDPGYKLQVTFA
jgi:hypothetical protein